MNRITRLARAIFGRRWWWVTLLVVAMMLLLARLGIWQLDRLAERHALNAELEAALAAAPLDLNRDPNLADVDAVKDRQVVGSGTYDFSEQVILKLQNWQGRAGVHLVTPLVLEEGETAVLVDRGWIPDAEADAEGRAAYDVRGTVTVSGTAALTQTLPRQAASSDNGPQTEWYRIDIEAIERQMPYDLLPVYIIEGPAQTDSLPFREEPEIDLSEGPHLGYAVQWFIFSIGLGIGYLAFVHTQLEKQKENQQA